MLHVTAAGWAVTIAVIAGLLAMDWLLLGPPSARRLHRPQPGSSRRSTSLWLCRSEGHSVW